MSIAEAERFVSDLAKNPQLLAQVKPQATGLASVVTLAKARGYNFTLEEAKKYVQSRSPRELTDKQLDAVAGGKHHHSSVATSTKVAQTAYVASSAVEAAEVATTAVQVAEAAADVAAAAEAVVVVAAVLI